jgi:hypothetical protein
MTKAELYAIRARMHYEKTTGITQCAPGSAAGAETPKIKATYLRHRHRRESKIGGKSPETLDVLRSCVDSKRNYR